MISGIQKSWLTDCTLDGQETVKGRENIKISGKNSKIILYAAQFAVLYADYLEKLKADLHVLKGGYTVFQKYWSNFKTQKDGSKQQTLRRHLNIRRYHYKASFPVLGA